MRAKQITCVLGIVAVMMCEGCNMVKGIGRDITEIAQYSHDLLDTTLAADHSSNNYNP